MLLKSFSESTPFIWLQFTPKTTVLHNLLRALDLDRLLGGTREDRVQNPLHLVAQHYRQSSAPVCYLFGYDTNMYKSSVSCAHVCASNLDATASPASELRPMGKCKRLGGGKGCGAGARLD